MLGQRRRRWTSIETPLGQRLVLYGDLSIYHVYCAMLLICISRPSHEKLKISTQFPATNDEKNNYFENIIRLV